MQEDLVQRDIGELCEEAAALRDRGKGKTVSFSLNVFLPLTRLCRNACSYCDYRLPEPFNGDLFLSPDAVLATAQAGDRAGCTEALFVTGDKPELRYPPARRWLKDRHFDSTAHYACEMARLVLSETRLYPHTNVGVANRGELIELKPVNASLGLMLETTAARLSQPGEPHGQSPDKLPRVRLDFLAHAGELGIPTTTGLLIGIGETRQERVNTILAIRKVQEDYGHIQEVIVQNFRPRHGLAMAGAAEVPLSEILWTCAAARLILGPCLNVQIAPNLVPGRWLTACLAAGINDWGGVSPLTPDYVNSNCPWPPLAMLRRQTETAGFTLRRRFPVYPEFIDFLPPALKDRLRQEADEDGYVRTAAVVALPVAQAGKMPAAPVQAGCLRSQGEPWQGSSESDLDRAVRRLPPETARILSRALEGSDLSSDESTRLFDLEGEEVEALFAVGHFLRTREAGSISTYVVNRNINFTNICYNHCGFCAYSRPRSSVEAFSLTIEEVLQLAGEAQELGATEVCVQAGVSPDLDASFYPQLCRMIRQSLPDIHIHGCSPQEVLHWSRAAGMTIREYLCELKDSGLNSLPGTSAEILDDRIRSIISPRRMSTMEWTEVIETAHSLGLRTSATIMYGHIEGPHERSLHLLRLRDLQRRTGGFTEFVPLSLVSDSVGRAARGRLRLNRSLQANDVLKMHAIARVALGRDVPNIQVSWVKEGLETAKACLRAGANDLGGTLMNESISSSAGARNGELMRPRDLRAAIRAAGFIPAQRDTLYRILRRFDDPAEDPVDRLDREPGAGRLGPRA